MGGSRKSVPPRWRDWLILTTYGYQAGVTAGESLEPWQQVLWCEPGSASCFFPWNLVFSHVGWTQGYTPSEAVATFWGFLFVLLKQKLIYNSVLISDVQKNESVRHKQIFIYIHRYIFFFRFCSILGYYKILNIVPRYTVGARLSILYIWMCIC